jgi:hypothetical protein
MAGVGKVGPPGPQGLAPECSDCPGARWIPGHYEPRDERAIDPQGEGSMAANGEVVTTEAAPVEGEIVAAEGEAAPVVAEGEQQPEPPAEGEAVASS